MFERLSNKINKDKLKLSTFRNLCVTQYEGCSINNVTCIGAHIAEVLLFILICSALQNTLRQPEHTFLAGQSIFGSILHTLQWGHPSDTDKQQIQGHFSNCISFQINDIWKEKKVAGGQVWRIRRVRKDGNLF